MQTYPTRCRRRSTLAKSALWTAAALLLGFMDPSAAQADALDADAERTRGAAVADFPTHLRSLWKHWEHTDAPRVDAALQVLAGDRSLPEPNRAHAAAFYAMALRRRGEVSAAKKLFRDFGYVTDLWVVGPFDNDNRGGLMASLEPETQLKGSVEPERVYEGKERPVKWRRSGGVHGFGYVDLGAVVRPERDVCVFASTVVRAKGSSFDLSLGATGSFKLFVDDALVLEDATYRQHDFGRHQIKVSVAPGSHRLTIKVCGDEAPPGMSLRLMGATADADAAPQFGRQQRSTKAAPPKGGTDMGPLARLARRVVTEKSAAAFETYARYLVETGGDPDGMHVARDFAVKAAEIELSVERGLLAAELAEDRNGGRAWLTKVAPLAQSSAQKVKLLLAQARLARTGVHWQDAVPYYDEALRVAPDNVEASLGKFDLYVRAGLPRTALSTLEATRHRYPHSVGVLRVLAGQLRALGRDVEALAVEHELKAYRFDDTALIKRQLEQAAARRDQKAVALFAGRLTSLEPTGMWAYAAGAQAYRQVGALDEAKRVLETALDVAPDDVGILRALSDLHGQRGERADQNRLLRRVLRIAPQSKGVRAYLDHMAPKLKRDDERFAWAPERFLPLRKHHEKRYAMRLLRKLKVTTVYDNGLASHFHQVVLQPVTAQGAVQHRQYVFGYQADSQVVQLRAARVFRADGRIDEAIERGEAPADNPALNMYTSQRRYIVRFPKLEVGDVVELQYRIDDVAVRNERGDSFGEIEYLESTAPTVNAEYVLVTPASRNIVAEPFGSAPIKVTTKKRAAAPEGDRDAQIVRRFQLGTSSKGATAVSAKPLVVESRMPPLGEVLAGVHVSTFRDWSHVGNWYWGLAKERLDVDSNVRALAARLGKGKTTTREKVAAVYHYAANQTRYVALEFGIEGIRPRRAARTLARGWGDCKDKATLIVSLLKEMGIAGRLVIVRTGLRGDFKSKVASLAPFDHAIAYVPELDLYLDGTAEWTGTNELPMMDRGAMAVVVDPPSGSKPATGRLVHLPRAAATASLERREVGMRLGATGSVRIDASQNVQGVMGPAWRRRYDATAGRHERATLDFTKWLGPLQLVAGSGSVKVANLDDFEQPFGLVIKATQTVERDGDDMTLRVIPAWDLVARFARSGSRRHDLLLGAARTVEHRSVVELPAGFKAVLPQSQVIKRSYATYSQKASVKGNTATIESRLQINVARIEPSDAAGWRDFCTQVDRLAGARLRVQRR